MYVNIKKNKGQDVDLPIYFIRSLFPFSLSLLSPPPPLKKKRAQKSQRTRIKVIEIRSILETIHNKQEEEEAAEEDEEEEEEVEVEVAADKCLGLAFEVLCEKWDSAAPNPRQNPAISPFRAEKKNPNPEPKTQTKIPPQLLLMAKSSGSSSRRRTHKRSERDRLSSPSTAPAQPTISSLRSLPLSIRAPTPPPGGSSSAPSRRRRRRSTYGRCWPGDKGR